jgi:diguanylate cyclase (GGDEF)-like protein
VPDNQDIERFLAGPPWVVNLSTFLKGSPWVANLNAALESKTEVALILGSIDNYVTIRDLFGCISLDHVLPVIEQMLHERFGDYSVGWGTIFLILVTGDEATKAKEIAESIRATVESMTWDERFNVTLHLGVTHASADWTITHGLRDLLKAADESIDVGKRKLAANRVYEPATLNTFWEKVVKR